MGEDLPSDSEKVTGKVLWVSIKRGAIHLTFGVTSSDALATGRNALS